MEEFLSWETVKKVSFYFAVVNVFLLVFGIVGNIISIVVFSNIRLRRVAVNILLIGISVTDLLLLITCIPLVILPQTVFAFNAYSIGNILDLIHFSFVFVYPMAVSFQTISVCLFIVITCERFIAVCHPLKAKIYCTSYLSKWCLFGSFVVSFAYNSVRFWEYKLQWCINATYCNNIEAVKLLGDNPMYLYYYLWVIPAILALLACIFIGVLNILIIGMITKSKRAFTNVSTAEAAEHKTAIMIIVVITSFVLCYGIHLFMYFYQAADPEVFRSFSTRTVAYFVDDLSKVLIMLNSASTWVVYCMSDSYRKNLIHLLLRMFGMQKNHQPPSQVSFRNMSSRKTNVTLQNRSKNNQAMADMSRASMTAISGSPLPSCEVSGGKNGLEEVLL